MTLPAWAARARPVDDPTLEVGFLVHDHLRVGPESRSAPEDREPVRPPALEIHTPPGRGTARYVLSRAAARAPEELARHYADLLRLAARHGLRADPRWFAVHPVLFAPDGFEVRFDSGYTWNDALLTLAQLGELRDGMFLEVRQGGWETDVVAGGGRLYVRAAFTDGDGRTDERACASLPRDLVARQIAPLRERTEQLLAALRRELGEDHWSRRWVYTALGIQIGARPVRDAAAEPAPPRAQPDAHGSAGPRPGRRPKWKNRQR